jgi:LysR family glycine cleavage system transcriptional activator
VALTTFASFASMWLIPRLEAFQRDNPEIDIRIDASDVAVDLEVADVDIALRYGPRRVMPARRGAPVRRNADAGGQPLAAEEQPADQDPADITRFTLIEAGDAHRTHLEWLTWRRWFDVNGLERAQPKRWLYFNYAYQMVQAALTGQGVVLARSSLMAESLANGDLVEVLPQHRMDSPMAYWLIVGPRSAQRPEIKAFWDWLQLQAGITRETIGEVPDPDTVDNMD